ncbi:hypothetical protein CP532_2238 [Ophiocordyceps camponoti-leonardi (nom. inval.)]|nr:hypothetical protein CP532_2238 [Ophiocordyceps camponoti-leonardi (nom. inval.)]
MERTDFFWHCPRRGLLTPLLDDTRRDCDYRSWDVYEVEQIQAPNSKRLVIWHHKRVSAVVYHQFKALEGLGPGVTQGIFARTDFENKDLYLILAYKGTMKQRDREAFYHVCKDVGREAVVGEPLEFRFADADRTMDKLWARVKAAGLMGINNRVEKYDRGLTFGELQDYLKRKPMKKNDIASQKQIRNKQYLESTRIKRQTSKMPSEKYQLPTIDTGSFLDSERFYAVLECNVKVEGAEDSPWREIILYNQQVANVIFYNFFGLRAGVGDHVFQGASSAEAFQSLVQRGEVEVVRRWGFIKEKCIEWFYQTCQDVGTWALVGQTELLMRDLWIRVDQEMIMANIH